MKAGSKLLNAVSAVALTAGVVASGASVVTLAAATPANAAVIRKVDVIGAKRVGPEAVKAAIGFEPGKNYSPGDVDELVKKLYATGYFSDVKVNVSGGTLVVRVVENNLINAVVFNGNDKLKDEQLAAIVKSHALGAFSQRQIDADIQSIRDAYAGIGRSDVKVTTQTYSVGEGRVNLAFVIQEGERTKISHINFSGNKAYSASRLQSVITTKESNMLSYFTRRDVYNEDRLHADEEMLRQFYYNHGYPDFRIVSSNSTLDPKSNEYTIDIVVDEGNHYQFGKINIESTVDGLNAEELKGLVRSQEGSPYSAKEIQKSIEAISRKVASAGYPFARVTPRGNRDFKNNVIGVDYLVDQGERAYVERIEIRGNTRTRDYVIRREFDLSEGDAFNQELIARAKRRLEALDYFSSVKITTAPGSAADRVVVIVDVQDQPTGSFGIGAGYTTGSDGGFGVEASIEEKNFLGRGQYIRIAAGGGTQNMRTYSLTFVEPYFLGYRLAAGVDLYHTETSRNSSFNYEETYGTLKFTAPITEQLSTTFKYQIRELRYSSNGSTVSTPYSDMFAHGSYYQSVVTNQLTFNALDDQKAPHEGLYAQLSQDIAGLGGDSSFYKVYGKARYYMTLSDEADIVGSLSGGAGYMVGLGNNLHVFDQFTLGGNEVRGFENFGIGAADQYSQSLGGTTYAYASAEANFPFPGLPQDLGLRGAVFADAGTLYGNKVSNSTVNGDSGSIRASVGASILWSSPFGPIRIDYAIPVLKESTDREQRFRFGISNQF